MSPPSKCKRPIAWTVAAAAICAAAAAASVTPGCGPFRATYHCPVAHYADPQGRLLEVDRVVLVPLSNETDYPSMAGGMTEELFRAVQCQGLFHVELAPPELAGTKPPGDAGKAFSLEELARMRHLLKTDAVLVGAVTQYQPHPRMQTGLYLRLLDLRDGRVLWAVDHVWDAADRGTQDRMRFFYATHVGRGQAPVDWHLATVSPRAFQQFAAWEVARTLPVPADVVGAE